MFWVCNLVICNYGFIFTKKITCNNDETLSFISTQREWNPELVTSYKASSQRRPSNSGAPELWPEASQPSRKQEAQPALGTTFTHSFHSRCYATGLRPWVRERTEESSSFASLSYNILPKGYKWQLTQNEWMIRVICIILLLQEGMHRYRSDTRLK